MLSTNNYSRRSATSPAPAGLHSAISPDMRYHMGSRLRQTFTQVQFFVRRDRRQLAVSTGFSVDPKAHTRAALDPSAVLTSSSRWGQTDWEVNQEDPGAGRHQAWSGL